MFGVYSGDEAVIGGEEEVIERLRGLNSALNVQLENQREMISELTQEKQRSAPAQSTTV